ncbi:collagen alpha-1(I) chain-like [Prionailurus viverrinus]|uniref:collagen alpha-1(I) chain-like n=1 Tax=Prionailurus viverrinus TaxID=61388 RepID=UPI001FF1493B|nr:collagen alpha-1(I) chain-like [Prionailurus viverrinus]
MRQTRPQHPRPGARGEVCRAPGPEAPLLTRRGTRPRPAACAFLAYRPVDAEGGGAVHPPAPAAPRRPPGRRLTVGVRAGAAAGDARLSPPGAGRGTCAPGPRPKLCAGRSSSRSSSREALPAPKPGPPASAGGSGHPRTSVSSAPPPRPSTPAAAGPRRSRLLPGEEGGSPTRERERRRCAFSFGLGRDSGLHCSAPPERQNLVGEAAITAASVATAAFGGRERLA